MPRPRSKNLPNIDLQSSSSTPSQMRMGLIEARKAKEFSQLELADLLGTTPVNVSRWERGITRPNPYYRDKLSKLLGRSQREMNLTPERAMPEESSTTHSPAQSSSSNSNTATPQKSRETALNSREHLDPSIDAPEKRATLEILPVFDPLIPLKPAKPLVGRENEISQVRVHLRQGGNIALTALNGLPGVGKTALSITIANDEEVRQHFRDGILWAGLGPEPDLKRILSHWGTLLGIPESKVATLNDVNEWVDAIRTSIEMRTMLIVIDDVWQLEDALLLKVGGPHCAHLLTTRFTGIASDLTDGEEEGILTLSELDSKQSMDLLRRLAPNAVQMEVEEAKKLVQAVGGLPLALTLLGNYLRKESQDRNPKQVHSALQRLTDASTRLNLGVTNKRVESHTSLSKDDHISLQTLFSVTDQRILPEERASLYALSVFLPKPDDFSEEAAIAVANCDSQVIYRLKDTGLLESKGGGRYTLHQTVADYAHLKLVEQGTQQEAQQRLIAYALDVIHNHRKDYDMLEREQGVLLHALDLANTREHAVQLIEGATGFTPFLLLRALYSNAAMHLERAHKLAIETHNERGIISTLLYQGELALRQNRYDDATSLLTEGLARARRTNEQDLLCDLLDRLGGVAWKRGENTIAYEYFQEGLAIARNLEDTERICNLLKALALTTASLGNYKQERKYLTEGVKLAEHAENYEQLCVMLMNLGVSTGEQGNYAQAEKYFQKGLVIARKIGHKERTSALLSNLGDIASTQGDYKLAEHYFKDGLTTARQINNHEWWSILLLNLGVVMREQGKYAPAENYLEEGLAIARQIGIPHIICNGLYEFGTLALLQQDIPKAEGAFDSMRGVVPEGDQELQALATYGIARVFAAKGKNERARKLARESAKILREMGNRKADEIEQWIVEALPIAC